MNRSLHVDSRSGGKTPTEYWIDDHEKQRCDRRAWLPRDVHIQSHISFYTVTNRQNKNIVVKALDDSVVKQRFENSNLS
jgi:hypothetical protein